MKKLFYLFTLLFVGLLLTCCSGCKKENPKVAKIVVENVISTDREQMYLINPDNKWFETGIIFKKYLDEENDGTIEEIVNVFQTVDKEFDTQVYKFQHFEDGTSNSDSVRGFWIEDYPLNYEEIKVSFKDAFEIFNKVNLPKPHSRYCFLRKPVGPLACNAQWIFGNIQSQIWIDAITGEVRESNPAFPNK